MPPIKKLPTAILLLFFYCLLLPSAAISQSLGIWNNAQHLVFGQAVTPTEFMRLTTGGNLGIGVTVPERLLHVAGGIRLNPVAAPPTPVLGDIYVSVGGLLYVYNGASWDNLSAGATSWSRTGNAGTVDNTHFTGTTDSIPFNIRVNNQKAGRISSGDNLFLGYLAGANSNVAVKDNVAIGDSALYTQSFATAFSSENVAIGNSALFLNNPTSIANGYRNTAVGNWSLRNNTTGRYNTASGYQSLYSNTAGNSNTAPGYLAMFANTTGSNNTALGINALYNNVTGSNATAIGTSAMYYANDQAVPFINYNVAVGYEALRGSVTAASNTGNYNTALGYQTLLENTSGGNNTALGYLAGYTSTPANANTTGSNNTFIGYNTGFASATQRTNATAIGYNAKVDTSNVMVLGGTGADAVNVGIGTTAPANQLHLYKLGASANASQATIIGENAFAGGTSKFAAIAGGFSPGYEFFPHLGFISNTYANVGTGAGTIRMFIDGTNGNLGIGTGTTVTSARLIVQGATSDNTVAALNATNSAGTSLFYVRNDGNLGIGTTAPGGKLQINAITDGLIIRNGILDDGIILDKDFVRSGWIGTNLNIGGSNNLVFSTFSAGWQTRMTILNNGNVGIGCLSPTATLHVGGSIRATTTINTAALACSDIRYKEKITPLKNSLSNILKLNGVNYFWKDEEFPEWGFSKTKQIGFIAQEIEKIYPEVVVTDKEGYKAVDYSKIAPILVEAIKEQQKTIQKLETRNLKLETSNLYLQTELSTQKKEIEKIKEYLEIKSKK